MRLLIALRFLTVIPVLKRYKASAEEVGASQGYFPLVGLFLGAILVAVNWLFNLILPSSLVDVFLIITILILTGALHIDGFIDTCDAFFVQKEPEERWRIMSDSRVGSFGVIGAFCLLLLLYVSLRSIPETYKMTALLLMPVLSRWSVVYVMFAFPYAKPEGLGKAFKAQASWQRFVLATAFMLASVLGWLVFQRPVLGLMGLAVIFVVWLAAAVTGWLLQRRFAGLTGDSYGAVNEVIQVLVLILFNLISRW